MKEPITGVTIHTDSLNVQVQRDDSNYVHADVNSDERSKKFILEQLEQVTSGKVILNLIQQGESHKSGKITIGTTCPKYNVTASTMSGSFAAANCGEATVNTMSGSATLCDCGPVKVTTMSGSANVEDAVGKVDMATMSGSAYATNCKGPTDIGTMSGTIRVKNCGGPNYANSMSGSIDVEGGLRGGKARSTSGSVNVS